MRTWNCTRLVGEKNWSVAEERTKPNEKQIIKINISIIVYHEDQSEWKKRKKNRTECSWTMVHISMVAVRWTGYNAKYRKKKKKRKQNLQKKNRIEFTCCMFSSPYLYRSSIIQWMGVEGTNENEWKKWAIIIYPLIIHCHWIELYSWCLCVCKCFHESGIRYKVCKWMKKGWYV